MSIQDEIEEKLRKLIETTQVPQGDLSHVKAAFPHTYALGMGLESQELASRLIREADLKQQLEDLDKLVQRGIMARKASRDIVLVPWANIGNGAGES